MAKILSKNRRIVRNTMVLYLRSLIVMVVALYTSRLVLRALGIEDYGLYNVIGGVVGLFSFLRTSMTKSTQRFLNYELGASAGRLKDVFSVSLTIHVIIAVIALILAETVGLWFLNTYIDIPAGREYAANVVYQSTIISLVITIISVPYNASIIAHERMGYFALVTMLDAFLKLGICFLILKDSGDRLITYAWLMAGVNAVNLLLFVVYSLKKCPEVGFRLMYDKALFKEMLGYTTWTVVGQAAILGTNNGNNILINMFHSVTANAAMGVANQVNHAVTSFTSSFQTAFNPQITKSFAAKNYDYLKSLVYSTSKISYSLLTLVSIPIVFNIEPILDIWLDEVPMYTGIFVVLVLANSILNAASAPLNFTALSSGRIKMFQIVTSIVYLSDLVLVYLLFRAGFPPTAALAMKVVIMAVVLGVRLYYANKAADCINTSSFIREVGLPMIASTAISVAFALLMFRFADTLALRLGITALVCAVSGVIFYFLGLSRKEKELLMKFVRRKN